MSEFKFMSIKINYKNNISKNKPKNVVFFVIRPTIKNITGTIFIIVKQITHVSKITVHEFATKVIFIFILNKQN